MDGIEMDSEAMTGAMEQMDAAGQNLSTGWGEISNRLSGMAGRLGQGELGAAYLDRYQKPAEDTAAAVEGHCLNPGLLASMGHDCVGLYQSADRNSAGGFNVNPAQA